MSLNYKKYITEETINEFTSEYVNEIKEKENHIYVKLYRVGMGPSPEFHVTDYTFKGINSYQSFDLSKEWINHMLHIIPPSKRKDYAEEYNRQIDNLKIPTNELDFD